MATLMSPERLAEIAARAKTAEKAGGACGDEYNCGLYGVIADLTDDIPALSAEVRRLQKENESHLTMARRFSKMTRERRAERDALRASLAKIHKAAEPIMDILENSEGKTFSEDFHTLAKVIKEGGTPTMPNPKDDPAAAEAPPENQYECPKCHKVIWPKDGKCPECGADLPFKASLG